MRCHPRPATAAGSRRCAPGLVRRRRRRSSSASHASAGIVPAQRHRRHREIGPSVGHPEVAEVDVPATRPSSSISVLGAHASPWQTTSRSTGGGLPKRAAGGRRRAASRPAADHSNGHVRTGSRSCSVRSPAPIARTATSGAASQRGCTADRPGSPRCAARPGRVDADPSTRGTARYRRRPAQPPRLGGEGRVPRAASHLDELAVGAAGAASGRSHRPAR